MHLDSDVVREYSCFRHLPLHLSRHPHHPAMLANPEEVTTSIHFPFPTPPCSFHPFSPFFLIFLSTIFLFPLFTLAGPLFIFLLGFFLNIRFIFFHFFFLPHPPHQHLFPHNGVQNAILVRFHLWCGVAWCGVVWRGVALCGVV